MMKRAYFVSLIDSVFYVGRACDKHTRDAFQSSRSYNIPVTVVRDIRE